jgi:hypothetical protein
MMADLFGVGDKIAIINWEHTNPGIGCSRSQVLNFNTWSK